MTDLSTYDDKYADPDWYPSGEYHEVFRRLRDEEPLRWVEDSYLGRNYWVATRYDDVKTVINDSLRFSSTFDSRIPRQGNRLTTMQRHELMFDASLALMDPPFHTVYRAPINKHFSVPAIARMASDVDSIVDGLLDKMAETTESDFVKFAAELPMRVVFALLGVPEGDWKTLEEFAWQAFSPASPQGRIEGLSYTETAYSGLKSIGAYGLEMARDRQKNPKDDLATIISQMIVDGTVLDEHEIAQWFQAIIIGGLETTRNAASAGLWLFLTNPDQRDLLVSNPGLAKSATEEILRWVTPARGRLRVARTDYEMHGKTIAAGDWVIAFLASANKDDRQFDNPYAFDITRTPNEHLALGIGTHLCLGRAVARLELGNLFTKIFERFPDIELVGDGKPNWIPDQQVTGLLDLHIRYTEEKSLVSSRV